MKAYYLTGQGWMVCLAKTKAEAKREGIDEWGRGGVRTVRAATADECVSYQKTMGCIVVAEDR